MSKYYHLPLTILLFVISCFEVRSQDSVLVSSQLRIPIIYSAQSRKNDNFAICGTDSSLILRLHKKQIININEKAKLPANIHYSALLLFKPNVLLLGTSNSYVYCVRNNKSIQLYKLHGLTDSCITNLNWDKDNKTIVITTKSARFLLTINNNRFTIKRMQGDVIPQKNKKGLLYLIKNYFRQPIQKAICNSVSDIDLSGRKQKFISNHELSIIKKQLLPGDILLKRNENQLINIGIPGIWTHSAIYIGGENELNDYFKGIEMLGTIKPYEYIKYHYPSLGSRLKNGKWLIIEAIGEGVVINPLSHCARVDRFVAFRSNLSRQALFQSLLQAFENYKKPYDFLFDFESDDALVCSELVFKSFRPNAGKDGITFKMGSLTGKTFLSPSDIANQFCEERNSSNPTFTLVVFYKGDTKVRKAFLKNEEDLCH